MAELRKTRQITHHKIIQAIYEGIREIRKVNPRMYHSLQNDLGLDSLDLLELQISVEEKLKVKINKEKQNRYDLTTIKDFSRYILENIGKG